jgi:cytochrome c-type biogenesis protein CcsB
MRLIPPPTGALDRSWHTMLELFAHAETDAGSIEGLDPETATRLRTAWATLANSWAMHAVPDEDPAHHADVANSALAELATLLPSVAPEIYPERSRLGWESWYFAQGHFTWVWIVYMLAIALLLAAVVYKWPAARGLGMGVFLAATALHTFAVFMRWYVSGHWPNSNMFEAVTTAAWMGAAGAIVFEIIARKTAMRNLFALSASVAGAIALMCAHFMPVSLSPELSNRMPILHDVWLYIHTNVIIFSYILIAMAAATALGYVALRLLGAKPDYARGGGAGTLVGMGAASMSDLSPTKPSPSAVLDGATMILMELAFVLLWAGIIMGAIWADHSWGRPWGWDPKEVFALNTFIVFVILVHVRLKTSDKGLWTALLALAGCAVMVFNWIVINFVISGLHSYA